MNLHNWNEFNDIVYRVRWLILTEKIRVKINKYAKSMKKNKYKEKKKLFKIIYDYKKI